MEQIDYMALLKSTIVRFWYKKNVVGVGFLVDSLTIVTCAHVIVTALGFKTSFEEINPEDEDLVDFDLPFSKSQEKGKARIVFWDSITDFAGLEIIQNKFSSRLTSPLVILNQHELRDHTFQTFGFPNNISDGVWVKGKILGENASGWIQIEDEDVIGHFIEEGFSGGPVWDNEVNSIVGMIVAVEKPLSQRTAFFISMRIMAETWSDLWNYSFSAISNTWNKQNPSNFDQRELDIESPLIPAFENYKGSEFWHLRAKYEINRIIEPLLPYHEFSKFVSLLKKINFDSNYEDIWENLKNTLQIFDKHASKTLNEIILKSEKTLKTTCRQLRKQSRRLLDDEKELLRLDSVRLNIRRFRELFVYFTEFSKIFLILGEMGSGKSYFIKQLIVDTLPGYWIVLLEPNYAEKNLKDAILGAVQRASGINWFDLLSVNQFLNNCEKSNLRNGEHQIESYYEGNFQEQRRLVIVLDDLSRFDLLHSRFLDELTYVLKESTQLHNIQWILTAPHYFYSKLCTYSVQKKSFWFRYGFVGIDSHVVDKWIVLDDLDREEKIGLDLIQEYIQLNETDDSITHTYLNEIIDDELRILDLLCNPLIAWIWLDCIQEIKPNINSEAMDWKYIQFIDAFWNKQARLLINLEENKNYENPLGEIELRRFVHLIARFLNKTGEFYPKVHRILNWVVETSKRNGIPIEIGKATTTLNLLKKGLILREQTSQSLFNSTESNLEILIDGFWGSLLSTELLKTSQTIPSSPSELEDRFKAINPKLLSVSLEFFLWRIDSQSRLPDIALRYCDLVLQSSVLPHASVWRVGSHASEQLQRVLVNRAQRIKSSELDSESVFAILSFLNKLPKNEISIPNRFSILQKLYSKIKEYSLVSYFYYVVEMQFIQIEKIDELIDTLPFFTGSEILEITESLGILSSNTLWKHTVLKHTCQGIQNEYTEFETTPESIDAVLAYVKKIEHEYPDKRQIPDQEDGWKRYLFREWLFFYYLSKITKKMGVEVYEMFLNKKWYSTSNNRCLQKHMEQEANIAIGKLFRMGKFQRYENSFVDFVNQLSKSNRLIDRQNAFFIIYHTVPAKAGRMLENVSPDFYESLDILKNDKKLSWLKKMSFGKALFDKIKFV